jgi:DNA-binding NtrC family response regulator
MRSKGRVFLLDDDELIVDMLARALTNDGYEILAETDPEAAVEKIRNFSPDVAVLDNKLPGKSGIEILQEVVAKGIDTRVVMLTCDDTAETAVKAMKSGAVDYLTKPFTLDAVKIVLRGILEKGSLMQEAGYLRKVSDETLPHEFVGRSGDIEKLKAKAGRLAEARVPMVLITGESGTGKEVLARYIHGIMRHRGSPGHVPFIGINCAALPESLIESELFGHEKGSFTDAKAEKKGLFEQAYGGSILLDEIGEMKPNLQSKLLRVLEERRVRRIGGKQDVPIDVTIFATTNRNLAQAVERGDFRMDLFYRLNAFALTIPPLRERKEDVVALADHFLEHFSDRYGRHGLRGFSSEAERLLMAYGWPGNARELRNVIERIVVLESGETILPEHLPIEVLTRVGAEPAKALSGFTLPENGLSLDEMEKNLIVQALEKTRHNKTLAARLLGITYDSLRYQIKKFGLE